MKESGNRSMATRHQITVNGKTFTARRGELLLDAALNSGVDIPHDCRSGRCGTCCVRLVSGAVDGGNGVEPGVVHACQCRIAGDAVVERGDVPGVCSVRGVVRVLRPLSAEVWEAGIVTERPLFYRPGQYVQIQFDGFPSRPFSITHALHGPADARTMFFHLRRMANGQVTRSLGGVIKPGHRVTLSGPFGAAHFRPKSEGRLILIATNTGFAPIWSIAVAALRENPGRAIVVIAGGRGMQALYMGPALAQLARFPNVMIIPVCSGAQHLPPAVKPGRPTDHLPPLMPGDEVYACGAQGMVDEIKAIGVRSGAKCYADPFVATASDVGEENIFARARDWLTLPRTRGGQTSTRHPTAMPSLPLKQVREGRHLGS
jgi:3-phenylpropionate/trans-cinnamate dioxygenase ferredoxin reductase subunit